MSVREVQLVPFLLSIAVGVLAVNQNLTSFFVGFVCCTPLFRLFGCVGEAFNESGVVDSSEVSSSDANRSFSARDQEMEMAPTIGKEIASPSSRNMISCKYNRKREEEERGGLRRNFYTSIMSAGAFTGQLVSTVIFFP